MKPNVRGAAFTIRDLVYHSPMGVALLARLYRPTIARPRAAVVDVHGGRWCAETRLTNRAIDEALAAAGVFVMALDFRMPPVARYPAPVADIQCAIRWLHAHAAEFGIDPATIGGVGTSSGGHQLLLNALRPSDPAYHQDLPHDLSDVSPDLAYAVVCWPVTDPPTRYAYARERKMDIHIKSHDAYWRDVAQMAEGSPLRIVDERAFERLPPLLMIQGGGDIVLSPGMSERFAEAYRAAGGNVVLNIYPGEPHTFINKSPETSASQQALVDIRDYILTRARAAH